MAHNTVDGGQSPFHLMKTLTDVGDGVHCCLPTAFGFADVVKARGVHTVQRNREVLDAVVDGTVDSVQILSTFYDVSSVSFWNTIGQYS